MHVYYLRAITIFHDIKSNDNINKKNQLKTNFIMIFVIKFSSELYWSFKNNIKLVFKFYIL
jgi:hypothetical protein